jgi:hypothetical protein
MVPALNIANETSQIHILWHELVSTAADLRVDWWRYVKNAPDRCTRLRHIRHENDDIMVFVMLFTPAVVAHRVSFVYSSKLWEACSMQQNLI